MVMFWSMWQIVYAKARRLSKNTKVKAKDSKLYFFTFVYKLPNRSSNEASESTLSRCLVKKLCCMKGKAIQ